MAELRKMPGTAARALEFSILTAARTGETIGATWSEIDLDAGTWVVPAGRMKAGALHTVALSPPALAIVRAQAGQDQTYVFPSPTGVGDAAGGRPLSNMAMLQLLKRMEVEGATVHGFRASFSTWANETGIARPDVVEACLAHKEQDLIRKAYNRSQFHAERAALLVAWSRFCDGHQGAQVVDLAAARKVQA
jgi:integrase